MIGEVVKRWRPLRRDHRCQLAVAVKARAITSLSNPPSNNNSNSNHILNNILLEEDDLTFFHRFWSSTSSSSTSPFTSPMNNSLASALARRDVLVLSFCSDLYGLQTVKLALLLTLIGGVDHRQGRGGQGASTGSNSNKSNNSNRRSNIHMLLVGDPGSGKSQLLRFASRIAHRSVLTTGIGTTGAGLTCTARREGNNDWYLEAGALVLANQGICCIDEFLSMKEQDRAAIHEAMEQQSISVAKAGLLVRLDTRCSILAGCNPKQRFDSQADIAMNTGIARPLLSRFDIVFALLDNPDQAWDLQVSRFLLQRAIGGGGRRGGGGRGRDRGGDDSSSSKGCWSMERLKAYIRYVRQALQPQLSSAAYTLIHRYYSFQRQGGSSGGGGGSEMSAHASVRLFESIIRISEAHCKLMFRSLVKVVDVIVAIDILSHSAMPLRHADIAPNQQANTRRGASRAEEGEENDSNQNNESWIHYQQCEQRVLEMLNLRRDELYSDRSSLPQPQQASSSSDASKRPRFG